MENAQTRSTKMGDRLHAMGRRLRVWFHRNNLTDDLERDVNHSIDAADGNLGIRAKKTANNFTNGAKRKMERLNEKILKRRHKRTDFEARVSMFLHDIVTRNQMSEVAKDRTMAYKLGALVSWISPYIIIGLAIVMLANDPSLVTVSVQEVFGVSFSDLGTDVIPTIKVIFSVAVAFGIALGVLGFVGVGSNGLAWALFHSGLGTRVTSPTIRIGKKLMTPLEALIIFVISLPVLGWLTFMLHSVVNSYVGSGAFGGASVFDKIVAWYVTFLPWMLLIADTIKNNPKFKHSRDVKKWAKALDRRRDSDINYDEKCLKKERRFFQNGNVTISEAHNKVNDVSWSVDSEVYEAGLRGLTEVDESVKGLREKPDASVEDAGNESGRGDFTHRIPNKRLQNLAEYNQALQDAAEIFDSFEPTPASSPAAQMWQEAWQAAEKEANKELVKIDPEFARQ
ncbi:hypothetical protein OZX67_02170 [Bifidobacterium sp. ESL0728]|uniref:hypothetical protein n=1 Tax=Bifidobacterium sp. ESL0728 TaxID=2983220 RepID=UPI0023F6B8A8|nr:hypothetical protein [Bifidobacterium sp. ESL0728]WEV59391.1 hypothetical protein OZX67_02170 [Bifidobacterium sp. ESL0728]